jgi:hypothetical protein
MAELSIRLTVDQETGKKNLIIEYESDSDALPVEHEEDHRRLVNELVEGGLLKAGELGKVVVQRGGGAQVATNADAEAGASRESVGQGS